MEPRPLTPLALALAFLLAADSPLLTFSLPPRPSLPPPPTRRPPPLLLPPPPSSSPPPSPSSPGPPRSLPVHQHAPPMPSAQPNDDQGTYGRSHPFPPPVSCAIVGRSACNRHPSPPGGSGRPSGGELRRVSRLNLGKKVGLSFVAVLIVLQVALGSFLVYKRRQIGKVPCRRDLASASPSALSSASRSVSFG